MHPLIPYIRRTANLDPGFRMKIERELNDLERLRVRVDELEAQQTEPAPARSRKGVAA